MGTAKLSKALQGKFEMVGYGPGRFSRKGVAYDTTQMSVKEADAAIKAGVGFIRRIVKSESSDKQPK